MSFAEAIDNTPSVNIENSTLYDLSFFLTMALAFSVVLEASSGVFPTSFPYPDGTWNNVH